MNIREINSQISVSPQIDTEDLTEIARLGFRSVVCHRPDGEAADQTEYSVISAAAQALGLEARYQPITPGMISDEEVTTFSALQKDLPAPILAYCRSGTRSATIWSLSQAAVLPLEDILTQAKSAGYEMTAIAPRIEMLGNQVKT